MRLNSTQIFDVLQNPPEVPSRDRRILGLVLSLSDEYLPNIISRTDFQLR